MQHHGLLGILLTMSFGGLCAQERFRELTKSHFPTVFDCADASFGDFDGDGHVDIVLAGLTERLLLQDPRTGDFQDASATHLPPSDGSREVVAGDVDGDGDLDLLLARGDFSSAGGAGLLLNRGDGHFVEESSGRLPAEILGTVDTVGLVDIDGDGDLDVVVGDVSGSRVALNSGSGYFTAGQALSPFDTFEYADFDGDGDLDLITAGSLGARLYMNSGAASLVDSTPGRFPNVGRNVSDLAVLDADLDGDDDVFISIRESQNLLVLNDGFARFSVAPAASLPRVDDATLDVAVGDVDGDADPDLVIAVASPAVTPPFAVPRVLTSRNLLYRNDGHGVFVDASVDLPFDDATGLAVALHDLDADGDPELLSAFHDNPCRLHFNLGSRGWRDASARAFPPDTQNTARASLGDLDGDGDLDAFTVGNGFTGRAVPFLNDGTGRFTDASATHLSASLAAWTGLRGAGDVALFDVDRDGDLDALAGQGLLAINDGNGFFTDGSESLWPNSLRDVIDFEVGDVDGDGDSDAIVVDTTFGTTLWLLDSSGVLVEAGANRLPLPHTPPVYVIELDDVDGDGDLDAAVGRFGQDVLLLNDGRGHFVVAPQGSVPPSVGPTFDLELVDLDGDGARDWISGNVAGPPVVMRNDGFGRFAVDLAAIPPGIMGVGRLTVADFDGDGAVDLALRSIDSSGSSHHLLRNDGTDRFVDESQTWIEWRRFDARFYDIVAGDVDQDGDQDLIDFGRANLVYTNLTSQLVAPRNAVAGRHFELQIYPVQDDVLFELATTCVAQATARVALPPFGVFLLDPLATVCLPPVAVMESAGPATVGFRIPGEPGLLGSPVHAQAILLSPLVPARLTGRVSARIY